VSGEFGVWSKGRRVPKVEKKDKKAKKSSTATKQSKVKFMSISQRYCPTRFDRV
jgi:hypothetical protein